MARAGQRTPGNAIHLERTDPQGLADHQSGERVFVIAEVADEIDAPVERGAPLIEFYAAVARKDLAGFSNADWHPEEKLSRAEALKLFTASAAYARFAEKDQGSISVGKRADLSGFSVDLMTAPEAEIPKGHAVLTVVDGQVVYQHR